MQLQHWPLRNLLLRLLLTHFLLLVCNLDILALRLALWYAILRCCISIFHVCVCFLFDTAVSLGLLITICSLCLFSFWLVCICLGVFVFLPLKRTQEAICMQDTWWLSSLEQLVCRLIKDLASHVGGETVLAAEEVSCSN